MVVWHGAMDGVSLIILLLLVVKDRVDVFRKQNPPHWHFPSMLICCAIFSFFHLLLTLAEKLPAQVASVVFFLTQMTYPLVSCCWLCCLLIIRFESSSGKHRKRDFCFALAIAIYVVIAFIALCVLDKGQRRRIFIGLLLVYSLASMILSLTWVKQSSFAQLFGFSLGLFLLSFIPIFSPHRLCVAVSNSLFFLSWSLFDDVKRQNELQRQLELKLDTDDLTGLLNRRGFVKQLKKLVPSAPKASYVLSCIDIEGFKVINDRFGYAEGDRLLRFIADTRKSEADLVGSIICRNVADQFLTLFPNDLSMISSVTHKFRTALEKYDLPITISVHVGRYIIDEPLLDANLMIDRVLLAARNKQGNGYGQVSWFSDDMRRELLLQHELIEAMHPSLERGDFVLFYQPQFDYAQGKLIGVEALVRWKHPIRGFIMPGVFIPLFEKNGSICDLDQYVWEEACKAVRRWLDQGLTPPPVSVNISRRDIERLPIPKILHSLLDKYHLDTSMLRVEITESLYMESDQRLIKVVEDIKKEGIVIEMDDFGSGYSSLNMLKDVPVDAIKLDMRFVSTSDRYERNGRILSSIIRMAHWLDLPVIAEGVETKEQADFLKSIGCTLMQGYLFSRPVPEDVFTSMVQSSITSASLMSVSGKAIKGAVDFLSPSSQATLLFNSFVGGAQIVEYDGTTVESVRMNDRFFEIIGCTRETYEERSKDILSQFSPEFAHDLIAALEQAKETGEETNCMLRTLPSLTGGKMIWTMNRIRFLAQNVNRYLFYMAVEDISARKVLESNLEMEKQKLFLALDSIQGIIWEYDIEKRTLTFLNTNHDASVPSHVENVPESLFAMGLVERASQAPFRHLLESAAAGIPEAGADIQQKDVDGKMRWFHLTIKTIFSEGKPVGAIGNSFDNEAEIEGRMKAQEMELAMDASSLFFWTYDYRIGAFIPKNGNAVRFPLLPSEQQECSEDQGFSTLTLHSAEELQTFIKRIPSCEKKDSLVIQFTNAPSGIEWMRLTFAPVKNDDALLLVVIGEDITAQMRNSQAYEQALSSDDTGIGRIRANLTTDVVEDSTFSTVSSGSSYMVAIGNLLELVPTEDERMRVSNFLKSDRLLDAFQQGRFIDSLLFPWILPHEKLPRWVKVSTRLFRDPDTAEVKAFLNYTDIDREQSKAHLRDAVVQSSYELLGLLSTETGRLRSFPLQADWDGGVSEQETDYDQGLVRIVTGFVPKERQKEAMKKLERKTIFKALGEQTHYSVIVPIQIDGRLLSKRWEFCWFDGKHTQVAMSRSDAPTLEIPSSIAFDAESAGICRYDTQNKTLTLPESFALFRKLPTVLVDIPEKSYGVAPSDVSACFQFFTAILKGKKPDDIVLESSDGKRWDKFSLLGCEGRYAEIAVKDVSKEREQKMDEQRRRMLVEKRGTAIFDYDVKNDRLEFELRGKRSVYQDIKTYIAVASGVHADSVLEMLRHLDRAVAQPLDGSVEFQADHWVVGYHWYRASYTSIADGAGKVFRIIGQIVDIQTEKDKEAEIKSLKNKLTDIKQVEEQTKQLEMIARKDEVSGLYTRFGIEQAIDDMLAKRINGSHYAFCMIDMDAFKLVNDTYGHQKGDDILSLIGKAISGTLEDGEAAGRIGGDEFVLMVYYTDEQQLRERLDHLLSVLHFSIGDIRMTASIGVLVTDGYDVDFKKLYGGSDQAMYQAKKEGKNRIVIQKA